MTVHLVGGAEREVWDRFVLAAPGSSFMQSWAWGEAQCAFGLPVVRLAVAAGDVWQAVALLVRRPLPLARGWLYAPRGPLLAAGVAFDAALAEWMAAATAQARQRRAVWLRIDATGAPTGGGAVSTAAWVAALERHGWRKADGEVQPRHTLVLDLDHSDEALLSGMHHKTRYNIRLAQRSGVTVRFTREAVAVEAFLTLAREVSARGRFRYHPAGYYRALYRVLTVAGMLELAVAEFEGQVLAVHWLVSWGGTVTYVHGASSSDKRQVMAPYLLHWESIRRARERDARQFDFFGVAPASALPGGKTVADKSAGGVTTGRAVGGEREHPWAGITRFKEGFGGRRVRYPGAYDFVLEQPWYWLYNASRKLRRYWR